MPLAFVEREQLPSISIGAGAAHHLPALPQCEISSRVQVKKKDSAKTEHWKNKQKNVVDS